MRSQRSMSRFVRSRSHLRSLAGTAGALALAVFASPGVAADLKAVYTFDGTLAPEPALSDPNAPALVAIDPINASGFETATVFGNGQTVYRFDGNASPTSGYPPESAGLSLATAGLISPDNYSIEMVFRFTEDGTPGWGDLCNGYPFRRVLLVQGRTWEAGVLCVGDFPALAEWYGWMDGGWVGPPRHVSTGAFHHLVLTHESGSDRARLYLDGVLSQEILWRELRINEPAGIVYLFAGIDSGGFTCCWGFDTADGQIALLRVYEGALAPSEVAALMPALPSPEPAEVRATYLFNASLAAEEPGAPPLLPVDPLGPYPPAGNRFETASVFGDPRTVYRYEGSADPGLNAGLRLDSTGMVSPDEYSVELVFEFTDPVSAEGLVYAPPPRVFAAPPPPWGYDREDWVGIRYAFDPSTTNLWASDWREIAAYSAPDPGSGFQHLIVTCAANGTVKAYRNGIPAFTTPRTAALDLSPAGIMNFCHRNSDFGWWYPYADGRIALIRVYDGVLSDAQAAARAAAPFVFDADSDGLDDINEPLVGTDPSDPDSDDDGLLDGTEVDMAQGDCCPGAINPDSDGDGLLDGDEVALGTNPCNSDSDGDGVGDFDDPLPTEPGVTSGWLEDECRELASIEIPGLALDAFDAPNANAAEGRRNALANRAAEAANALAAGDEATAIAELESLLEKIDGVTPPPDWMTDSPERAALAGEVWLLIDLLAAI